MKVWLFREPPPALPTSTSAFAEHWFRARGAETVTFTMADLEAGRLDADLRDEPEHTVVVGGVGAIHAVLARAGRPIPAVPDLPLPLRPLAGRRVWDATLGDLRTIVHREPERLPLHMKPHRPKRFAGVVVAAFKDLIPSAHVPDDEPVLVQEVVPMASEWRAVVLRREVLNVAHYKGDPLLFPDPAPLRAAVEAFADQPVAYSLDWAVTTDGRTLLIEVNDAYALGNYGLHGWDYCRVLTARWRQLLGVEPP